MVMNIIRSQTANASNDSELPLFISLQLLVENLDSKVRRSASNASGLKVSAYTLQSLIPTE